MVKYRDIADDLRTRIAAGEFQVGEHIDSIDTLRGHYHAALNTVRTALRILADQGIVTIEPGIGTTVIHIPEHDMPARMLARLKAMRSDLDEMIAELEEGAP